MQDGELPRWDEPARHWRADTELVEALSPLAVTGGRANAERALTGSAADADGDGDGDAWEACPGAADPEQADGDGDGDGDACDDGDADGVPDAADRCPTQPAAATRDGCAVASLPAPSLGHDPGAIEVCAPACHVPVIEHVSARTSDRRRRLTVRVTLDRAGTVYVTADGRSCRLGPCRWTAVAAKRVVVRRGSTTVKLTHRRHRRFPRGRYRVRVRVEHPAGTSPAATQILRIP